MSLTTGTIALPRRFESFKLLVANFTCDLLNGKLADQVVKGAQGYVVADFVKNRVNGVPRGAFGQITLIDGVSNGVLDIPVALIEIEEGAPEGSWKVLASFNAQGASADGHAYIFRSQTGASAGDTSLLVDFALADQAGLAGLVEAAKWAGTK